VAGRLLAGNGPSCAAGAAALGRVPATAPAAFHVLQDARHVLPALRPAHGDAGRPVRHDERVGRSSPAPVQPDRQEQRRHRGSDCPPHVLLDHGARRLLPDRPGTEPVRRPDGDHPAARESVRAGREERCGPQLGRGRVPEPLQVLPCEKPGLQSADRHADGSVRAARLDTRASPLVLQPRRQERRRDP
jgi:hypothetical protein